MSTKILRPLSIAVLNTADYAGGAESVARDLRNGLRGRGHDARLWVGRRHRETEADHTYLIPRSDADERTAWRYASKGFFNLGLPMSRRFCESDALKGVDIIHLHNLHGHYFSMTDVPRLGHAGRSSRRPFADERGQRAGRPRGLKPAARYARSENAPAERTPLVWTFHDHFPITGGCAYPFDCDRWLDRCGSCPQLGAYPLVTDYDRTRWMQAIKRRAFHDLPVTIVTPSAHLARTVRRSGVFSAADVRTIPNGVDTKIFRPHRREARQHLDLDPNRRVVMLAALGLSDPRKGVPHAVTALAQVTGPPTTVLLIGQGDSALIADALPAHDVRAFGYLSDTRELAHCYAAADLLLFTSLSENFPCVTLEAMASGTAVLAFAIDGVTEQISDNETGFLVPAGDPEALSHALDQILGKIERLHAVGNAARKRVENDLTLDRCIERHEQLYAEVLRGEQTGSGVR